MVSSQQGQSNTHVDMKANPDLVDERKAHVRSTLVQAARRLASPLAADHSESLRPVMPVALDAKLRMG
jgi:hypothetical protein